jgi:hypothetical protein
MILRFVFFAAVVLAATALLLTGGFGEIELLVDGQCGANGYLCEPPSANPDETYAAHSPTERRFGLR